jgi:CheY-like chemotaxis protein
MVSSAESFYASMQACLPDLVLMDIFLNGTKDGVELAAEIRGKFRLPVIFLTAYSDVAILERAKVTEPYGFILKPFQDRELHSSIEMALYKYNSERRIEHLNSVLRAIRDVNQLIVRVDNAGELIQRACESLISTRGYSSAWIALTGDHGNYIEFASSGLKWDTSEFFNNLKHGILPDCIRDIETSERSFNVRNTQDACKGCIFQDVYPESEVITTRISHQGRLFGTISVCIAETITDNDEEISLFLEIAEDLGLALNNFDQKKQKEQADREIIRARDEWENTFNAIPDLIAIIDAQHRLVKVNKAMALRLNCPADEIAGCHCFKVVHDLDVVPDFCPHARSLLSELEEHNEVMEGRMSGIFDVTTTPLFDETGIMTGSVHVARDITLHKKKEQLLAENLALGEFALKHSLNDLITQAINKAETLTGSQIGFFHFLDDSEQTISLQCWSTNTLAQFCEANSGNIHYPVASAGVWVDCIKERRPVIHNDYMGLEHKKGFPEGHVSVIRELTVPVIRGEKVVAILGVGNKLVDYNNEDVEIVLQLTNMVYEYIMSKRFEITLKKKVGELESYQRLTVDRELKMIELKKEINALSNRVGEGDKYIIHQIQDKK